MKAYGSEGTLDALLAWHKREVSGQLHLSPYSLPRNKFPVRLYRRLHGPQSRCGYFSEENKSSKDDSVTIADIHYID
jgi:hypothetical protein